MRHKDSPKRIRFKHTARAKIELWHDFGGYKVHVDGVQTDEADTLLNAEALYRARLAATFPIRDTYRRAA